MELYQSHLELYRIAPLKEVASDDGISGDDGNGINLGACAGNGKFLILQQLI